MASKVLKQALKLSAASCAKTGWRLSVIQRACYSSHPGTNRIPEDKPIKYSSSDAATWKAIHARRGPDDDKPWYQSIVISASVGIFLLYFCVLREESDIDEELGKSLYDRVPGLEEKQLMLNLKYYKERGLDTREIEDRLNELRNQKNQIYD